MSNLQRHAGISANGMLDSRESAAAHLLKDHDAG